MESLTQEIHLDLQLVLDKHHLVFETPNGLPPSRGENDHYFSNSRSSTNKLCPYRHPFAQNNEIEIII